MVIKREDIIKEGWHVKHTGHVRAKATWYVLANQSLYEFAGPNDCSDPIGVMSLRECTMVRSAEEESGSDASFHLECAGQMLTLIAESKVEMESWLAELNKKMEECPLALLVCSENGQETCSGTYELVHDEIANEHPVWQKSDGSRWLFTGPNGQWTIGGEQAKANEFKAASGFIHQGPVHTGAWPDKVVGEWQWWDDEPKEWKNDAAITVSAEAAPPVFRVSSPNGQKECSGVYELVVGERANGHAIWTKRGGGARCWIFMGENHQWTIGGEGAKAKNFACASGYIFHAPSHTGGWAHKHTSGWKWFDNPSRSWKDDPDIRIEAMASHKFSQRHEEHAAAREKKPWDGDGVPLAESNCAEIGTEADKAARKAAAATERSWVGVGLEPGTWVWRIESFQVVPWDKKNYGQFYAGDSYIVLHAEKEPETDKIIKNIYFWLGEKTSIDEQGTAAYKTVELDDFFDGEASQHREVMRMESDAFKAIFPSISYLEGGVDSGFKHHAADTYIPKLLHIRKTRAEGVRVTEVTLSKNTLNQGDCFILDAGTAIYVWCGESSSPFEKNKASFHAERLEEERDGHAKVTLDIDDKFWELLGEGSIKSAEEASDIDQEPNHGEGMLYKIHTTTESGEYRSDGELRIDFVAQGDLKRAMLDPAHIMMLDTGVEMCLWVGATAPAIETRNAMSTAMGFLKVNNKPNATPVHILKDGQAINVDVWVKAFSD